MFRNICSAYRTCRSVITVPTLETEPGLAGGADTVLGHRLHCLDHDVAVRAGAEPQVWVAPAVI